MREDSNMTSDQFGGIVALGIGCWAGYTHYKALYDHYIMEAKTNFDEYFDKTSQIIQFFHMISFPIVLLLAIVYNIYLWFGVK